MFDTRRKWVPAVLVSATITLIAVPTVILTRYRPPAEAGTAYVARIACGCAFISGRTLESCRGDQEPGMETIRLAVEPARRRVVASVPFLASAAATHVPGAGCRMER